MGESDPSHEHQMMGGNEEHKLKYLEFVHTVAVHSILCFLNLYGYAKDKSGPLKPGVESVEGAVKNIWTPVYHRFHYVPLELLKFVDRKVDESVTKLEPHVPPVVKQVSSQAYCAAQKAPVVARDVASEVQRSGVVDTASGIAKNVYTKYEPVAEHYAVSAWQSLNRLPLFPRVAQVVLPTASFCSEKYNQTVMVGAEKGYRVANYLPLVPTEKIAKVFGGSDGDSLSTANGNSISVGAH
ncbi:stress-related protein isoform X2 [Silene latifolia]|uniref:stress-related protein isoform X2 n=1 Tax=Silene latifolia TaxID=37657 RepID=UPI003D780F85